MKTTLLAALMLAAAVVFVLTSCSPSPKPPPSFVANVSETAQVPQWLGQDMDFFLHGSMSAEFVPEPVLRAFIRTYPEMFPADDLTNFGLIPDPDFGWPVGFSRGRPPHLGRLPSIGLNCAACHSAEIQAPDDAYLRILGVTSHFDVEAFYNAVLTAAGRTSDAANMKRFLAEYLEAAEPESNMTMRVVRRARFAEAMEKQSDKIAAAIADDPTGSRGAGPGGLQTLEEVNFNVNNLGSTTTAMLKLFHNMRAALHVPDSPPEKVPPASGPGRNDAFGMVSATLFNAPQEYAPVKFGVVWNVQNRAWVHWDGNTRSPIARNLLASLGLGAPLIGNRGQLDYELIARQTHLSEQIAAPKYPFTIDEKAAKRGAVLYQSSCISCHNGAEDDHRLYSPAEVGTDPTRANLFTQEQADRFNKFLAEFQTPGYHSPTQPDVRSTQEYWAASLAGVWARSPYLHNGSVRTMAQLLARPASRAQSFHRGSRVYDLGQMGYTDSGTYLFDTTTPGNSNAGHDYGTRLTPDGKSDLIEYLKTL